MFLVTFSVPALGIGYFNKRKKYPILWEPFFFLLLYKKMYRVLFLRWYYKEILVTSRADLYHLSEMVPLVEYSYFTRRSLIRLQPHLKHHSHRSRI